MLPGQDDALATSGMDGAVSLLRASQFQGLVNSERLQRASLESRRQRFKDVRTRHRVDRQRIDAEKGVAASIELEYVEGHRTIDCRDKDLAAEERHRLRGGLEVNRADRVEDDVRPAATGFPADHGGHVFAGGVDHAHRSTGVATIGLRLGLDPEYPSAQHRGDLYRGLPDLAVCPQNQDDVPGLRHAATPVTLIGGDEGHADGTGFDQTYRLRFRSDRRVRQHEAMAVGALARDSKVTSGTPDLAAPETSRTLDDTSRPVAPRCARPNRMRHGTKCGLDVGHVDAGAVDLDDDLVRLATRLEPLQLQIESVEMIGLLQET